MPGTAISPVHATAWGLIALGGVVLLFLLGRLLQSIWRRVQPLNVWVRYAEEASPYRRRRIRNWSWLGTLFLLLLALVLVGAGGGLLWLGNAVQGYQPFSPDTVVARLRCSSMEEGSDEAMTCSMALNTSSGPYTVTVQGARWEIQGETLVWDPALERFGLRSGYRLLHLVMYDAGGRVLASQELPTPAGGLGSFLPWLDSRFPFVQARLEVASGEAIAETLYELSASRAGFSLKKWEPVQP